MVLQQLQEQAYLAAVSLKGQTGLPDTTQNVGDALSKIVGALIYIIGGLSIIFIIVGGIQLATSAGNSSRVQQGRETILYAVVGLIVAIGAYAIVTFIASGVGSGKV